MKDKQIYVPDEEDLWLQVVKLHHNTLVVGHPSYEKTIELLQRMYFWPGMTSFVKNYISRCDRCARFKGTNQAPFGTLNPLEAPHMLWIDVIADFTTDLPISNGYDSILIVIDQFSKEVELISMTKMVTALETTKLYLFNMWKNHGLPCSIVSDQGPQFASQVMKDLCKCLGITPKLSTVHHPQTDGQTEWMNQDLQQYLWLFTTENQDKWADWLPIAQFSYNTKKSPFEITRSYVPRMGIEQRVSKAPSANELANEMAKVLEETRHNIIEAQGRMKTQADKHHMEAPDYKVGDKVWLSTMNLCLTRASKKLSECWVGPYIITKLISNNAVELKLPQSMKIHLVINISRVKLYKERLPGQPLQKPGLITVTEDCDIEYEVDYIVDSHWKGKWLEYLVHWSGFNEEDRTWELEGQLDNACDVIIDFHQANPSAP